MTKCSCPECGYPDTQVIHRQCKTNEIRLRRMCMNCGYVFNTTEERKKDERIPKIGTDA